MHKHGNLEFVITKNCLGIGNTDTYSASKLCNILFTKELAKKLKEEGNDNIKTCSLHPGVVRTELFSPALENWFSYFL